MNCRHCQGSLDHVFLDLGFAPPSNAYVCATGLDRPEVTYPLKLFVCDRCWLVQTQDHAHAEQLFDADYAYFSSVSSSWLEHARRYAQMAIQRFGLGPSSLVAEVASNDGYLLKNFVAAGIPCFGIEPTESTAAAGRALGIPVAGEFLGRATGERLARERGRADLVAGNNVFAHVPDINDFAAGLAALLKPGGTLTLEFPHLLELIEQVQFDTVYHEHFSYLSLQTGRLVLRGAGLEVFDVEQLPTHGGSLRLYAAHAAESRAPSPAVAALLERERAAGLQELTTYLGFQAKADEAKNALVSFLIDCHRRKVRVGGYGAAAKGNTLLNYAGVRPDLLPFICDAAPSKQGRFTPGTHIPIVHPDVLASERPDVVLVLPWNIAEEVVSQQQRVREWGGRFAVAIPRMRML